MDKEWSTKQQKAYGTLERNHEIYLLSQKGVKTLQIASQFGISRQRVNLIVKTFRELNAIGSLEALNECDRVASSTRV